MDAGETLVARWLNGRGLAHDFEPDCGVRTKPDFRVSLADVQVAIEVESIESWGGFAVFKEQMASNPTVSNPPLLGDGFTRGMDNALRPLRSQIRHAAKQLKPLAGLGMPLVVAVTNPYNRPVPFSADMMIAAMYGDPEYQFPADGGPHRAVLGRNGKLGRDHQYLSAVMLVRKAPGVRKAAALWRDQSWKRFRSATEYREEVDRLCAAGYFGDEQAVAVDLIETNSEALRVPAGFLVGPSDTHWVPNDDGTGITRVQ